jgi:hypothetical protein
MVLKDVFMPNWKLTKIEVDSAIKAVPTAVIQKNWAEIGFRSQFLQPTSKSATVFASVDLDTLANVSRENRIRNPRGGILKTDTMFVIFIS